MQNLITADLADITLILQKEMNELLKVCWLLLSCNCTLVPKPNGQGHTFRAGP